MCEHKLKYLRQSMVMWKGKILTIDVYQCSECKKYLIIDMKKDTKISLDNTIGEEI